MAEVVLFHSALGLRPGVTAAADRLRAAGHTVYAPDYYDGEVFDDLNDGLRKRDELGDAEVVRGAREAVAGLPAGLYSPGSPWVPSPPSCWPPVDPAPGGRC